jgi:integrase
VLSDRELRVVWQQSGDGSFGAIVKLLILTGCRRDEIGGLKWSEVGDDGVLVVDGSRTKNRRTLMLTLPPLARQILQAVPRGSSDYVFGARGGSFQAWHYAKVLLDHRITIAEKGKPLPRWTLHDLRRTMRSGLGRLGIRPDVAELVINHAKGGIQATYDRYSYQREIAAALIAWSEHVMAVVEDRASKVVPLRTA